MKKQEKTFFVNQLMDREFENKPIFDGVQGKFMQF